MNPGDLLLYGKAGWKTWFSDFPSRAIQVKTWSDVSHCEIVVDDQRSIASRNGIGVGIYPRRTDDLRHVLRPVAEAHFDMDAAMVWGRSCLGQGYDWWGLARFFTINEGDPSKQFCSEFATRFYRHGNLLPFHPDTDADLVSPGMFLSSVAFTHLAPVQTSKT